MRSRSVGLRRGLLGDNLPRLMAMKQQYDSDNLFHHARSVPLPAAT
ncbi:MAG: BBE domain-containing protein [Bradyrhizobium sp.]|nr:BBE domain-containing protein [Bradyrhizobium sp.]